MWPLLAGIGLVTAIAAWFSEDEEVPQKRRSKNDRSKSLKKKIFISFAIEDQKYRDFLVAQAQNEKSPFEFIDMSVKKPWEYNWKEQCRKKIKGCDGMIALLSKKTWHASGARWEMTCAKEERIPMVGLHIKKNDKGAIPPELGGKKVIEWSWDNLDKTIQKF